MKKFNVGIIGYGLIGKKRHDNLPSQFNLFAVCDIKKKIIFKNKKIIFMKDWKKLVDLKDIDIIIVCTYHHLLSKILHYSLLKKKHIFLEKPGSLNEKILKKCIQLKNKNKITVRVGYNHRFHHSICKASELIKKNIIGKLMYIKASYGHGGRLGYQNEWRFNTKLSGGGEIIDKGSHLIDLIIFFSGKIIKIKSILKDFFWKKNVEDNAFIFLQSKSGIISSIHASCTEWKNEFVLEIYGKIGKIKIIGKGGSYGSEKLTLYKMKKKMGKPIIQNYNFNKKNNSWEDELSLFYNEVKNNIYKNKSLENNLEILKIIKSIYRQNKSYDHLS